jgi:hypothetical protein
MIARATFGVNKRSRKLVLATLRSY